MSESRLQLIREEFALLPKDERNDLLDELCSLQERSGHHQTRGPKTTGAPARVKTQGSWAKPRRATPKAPPPTNDEVPLL